MYVTLPSLQPHAGSDSPLGGCVNDVNNMYQLLVETMGFPEEDINMLVDDGVAATDENYPSKANIEVRSFGCVLHK